MPETHPPGAFLRPPACYQSVDEFIRFWESVPVGEQVLTGLALAYRTRRSEWIGEELDAWATRLGEDADWQAWTRSGAVNLTMVHDEYGMRYDAELARVSSLRPAAIAQDEARLIAVSAQMYQRSGYFSRHEQEQIEAHRVNVNDEVSTLAVGELWRLYALAEVASSAFASIGMPDTDPVDAYVAFWLNAPINERALRGLRDRYATYRIGWMHEQLGAWDRELRESANWRSWVCGADMSLHLVDVEYEVRRLAEVQRLSAVRAETIDKEQARGITITAQLYTGSSAFSEADQERIEQHLVPMGPASGGMKVIEVWLAFGLREWVHQP